MQLLLIQEAENKILSLKKDQDYKFHLAPSSIGLSGFKVRDLQ